MKTNAVIRIVLWSIVIVVLVGVLLWGTGITRFLTREEKPAAAEAPRAVITEEVSPFPIDQSEVYTVAADTLNVRSAPTSDAQAVAVLEKGTVVTPTRIEEISGKRWGYITAPEQGWVVMEYIQAQSSLPEEAPAVQDGLTENPAALEAPVIDGPGTGYSAYPDNLRKISIEWALGDILIQAADVEKMEIREVNQNQDKVGDMVINALSQDKLVIRYNEKATWNIGISVSDTMKKDLYITVPRDFVLESLDVDAASATVTIQNMSIQEVDFDGASGTCDFINCDFKELDIDTASGDITFQGWLDELDCDAASASVRAVFENVPRSIDMDSMSGDLDITLPENAGFTVTMDPMSSDFVSDFSYSQKGKNTYYRGDGACKISMDAMSGDVYVRKFVKTAPQEIAVPTETTAAAALCPVHGADCDDPTYHH